MIDEEQGIRVNICGKQVMWRTGSDRSDRQHGTVSVYLMIVMCTGHSFLQCYGHMLQHTQPQNTCIVQQ